MKRPKFDPSTPSTFAESRSHLRVLRPILRPWARAAQKRQRAIASRILEIARNHTRSAYILLSGHFGDTILGLPLILSVKELRPDLALSVAVHPAMVDLCRSLNANITWIPFLPAWFPTRVGESRHKTRRAPGLDSVDIILDLRGELQSRLSIGRRRNALVLGLDRFNLSPFYDLGLPFDERQSMTQNLASLLTYLAPVPVTTDLLELRERLGLAQKQWQISRKLERKQQTAPLLLFAPEAGLQSKQWPSDFWIRLADRVKSKGIEIRVTGSKRVPDCLKELGEDWCGRHSPADAYLDFMGVTALVSVDSYHTHLAESLRCPSLVIASAANSPKIWQPTTPTRTVVSLTPACAGCQRRHCSHLSCMRHITVDLVAQSLTQLLRQCRNEPFLDLETVD